MNQASIKASFEIMCFRLSRLLHSTAETRNEWGLSVCLSHAAFWSFALGQ